MNGIISMVNVPCHALQQILCIFSNKGVFRHSRYGIPETEMKHAVNTLNIQCTCCINYYLCPVG